MARLYCRNEFFHRIADIDASRRYHIIFSLHFYFGVLCEAADMADEIAGGSGMTQGAKMLAGGCYCGSIGYQVEDSFHYAANCHCSNCRRTTGSAFKPFAGIPADRLTVIKGADDVMRFGDESGHNAHCRHCGSLLYSLVRDGAYVHVAMGTLIDSPSIRPSAHIFVGSKAPWYEITDDLPQRDAF